MTQTFDLGEIERRPDRLPRGVAELMRPELPSLAVEMIEEIRRNVPEYGNQANAAYLEALRIGVERALLHFVEQIADPGAPRERHDETYRRLGRFEAQEGRSLDTLQSAFRIGTQVAWRRVMKIAPRYRLPSIVMAQLADTLFSYLDELAALAQEGFLEERREGETQTHRRRLLALLVRVPAPSRRAVAEIAALAEWPPPEEATLVAVPADARCRRAALDDDLLVDLTADEPYLLVPGELTADRERMLTEALPEGRVVAGPTVPVAQAADSLRWARQALLLVESGVLGDGPVTRCEDHLVTLWLLADRALTERLARRHLAGLMSLPEAQRDRLLETLRVWLTTRGTAATIAEELHVHPQTVRYRMRQLENVLGDRLTDPESRFAIEVVLRALWLRDRADIPPGSSGNVIG
ncbi:helix-turn-helix domain-containing protein [Actinomadura kijaniata]|uniref:PucR family transcriptional regulator n=1 Tax=Actinomadura kijaniata TaxID=46161 RepID=UPI00082C36EF|nr:PucR family transcriptional regulator [Actinomadura kijaniata]